MSGYRSLHRELVSAKNETPSNDDFAIWQVETFHLSSASKVWSIVAACSDGIVRVFDVHEKTATDDALDASALTMKCTHVLLGINHVFPPSPGEVLVGVSQAQVARNYVGEDEFCGSIIVVAMDMNARMLVWEIQEDSFEKNDTQQANNEKQVRCLHDCEVEGALGTLIALCPPNVSGHGSVISAVACLDGSVAIVTTGLATPSKSVKDPAGTVTERHGSGSVPLSLCWHRTQSTIAVGRQDGLIDIIPTSKKGAHRLTRHSASVRALDFTRDGQMLVSGSDDGFLAVWDTKRTVPTLVHHVAVAHTSWILNTVTLSDSRRFVTTGADKKIHVWELDKLHAPAHTFQSDDVVWTLTTSRCNPKRLVAGSDNGYAQILSLEA